MPGPLYTADMYKGRSAAEEQQLTQVLAGDATPKSFDTEDATSCHAPAGLACKALLRALRR